jgi:Na+-translocating membrane potential-generating system (MpsC)
MVLMAGRVGAAPATARAAFPCWFPTACLSVSGDQPRLPWYQPPSPPAMNASSMRRESDEQFAERTAEATHNLATAMTDRGPMLEISNAVVGLYKETFGRGPTKVRAQFAGPDTLVVILESSLTVAERSLIAMGEHRRLRRRRSVLSRMQPGCGLA